MRFKNYLRSSSSFCGGWTNIFSLSVLLFWLGVVIFVAFHHEMWRDEAHCLYVALSADSLWQLPSAVKNEGHPILWYLVLWLGYHLTETPVVLQVVSIIIGFSSIVLFFRFAPFTVWFKILFLFSFLPFYEYTIMARNYGISMLFFFLFAILYPQKKEKPYLLAFILFALANTNIHSAIFVCLLALYWIYEEIFVDKKQFIKICGNQQLFLAVSIVFLGVLIAFVTVIPDRNSIVMQTDSISVASLFTSLLKTIVHPGYTFNEIFVGLPGIIRDLLIFVFAAGLLVRPMAALLLFMGAIALGGFFSIGYSGVLRHQGIFFIYVLTLYWITLFDIRVRGDFVTFKHRIFKIVLYGVIPFILFIHIVGSYKYIVRDITKEMSSSKSFGQFLREHEQYHDAIIMGEPDNRLESLPYYVDNRIFVPRINRYENYIKLIRENQQKISLGELLTVAKSLKEKENKTILIAIGHFGLSDQGPPFVRTEQYGRKFTWSLQELKEFNENTVKIAEFKKDVKNERYEIYQLK